MVFLPHVRIYEIWIKTQLLIRCCFDVDSSGICQQAAKDHLCDLIVGGKSPHWISRVEGTNALPWFLC